MGKDDKKFIADDDIDATRGDDARIDTDRDEESHVVEVKRAGLANKETHTPASDLDSTGPDELEFDEAMSPAQSKWDDSDAIEAEDIDKELDRVESIDTGALTGKPADQGADELEIADFEDDRATDVTSPVDLDAPVDKATKTSGKPGVVAMETALQSHHTFQKQHQKRRILQVLLLLFVVATIAAGVAAGYFYSQLADTKSTLSRSDVELTEARNQRDALQRQLNDQATADESSQQAAYRVIDELGVQYPISEATSDLVYGYGGSTSDGVTYAHYTTRQLADHQQELDGRQVFVCGIGMSSPVTVVRGTQAQLEALGATQSLTEQKQIGEYYYALMTPMQPCSAGKVSDIRAAQAAIADVFSTFEAVPVEAQSGDDEAEVQTP